MRNLLQVIDSIATRDGAGVKIQRVAGRHINHIIDPFLLIDQINSDEAADYIGGFPEHPHRGFETITYMKAGRMRHTDHLGNEGVIGPGDVQWMTAGAGVVHGEMPEQEQGLLKGFQIWLNLAAAEKMKPAAYRDVRANTIAKQKLKLGGQASIIAGAVKVDGQALNGALDAEQFSTEPVLVDVELMPNESTVLQFNEANPVLVLVYNGDTELLDHNQLGIYGSGDKLNLQAGPMGAEVLVLSGKPLKEPIAQYGPFVMNTQAQIQQALADYQSGNFV